jgi:hypothetical protein
VTWVSILCVCACYDVMLRVWTTPWLRLRYPASPLTLGVLDVSALADDDRSEFGGDVRNIVAADDADAAEERTMPKSPSGPSGTAGHHLNRRSLLGKSAAVFSGLGAVASWLLPIHVTPKVSAQTGCPAHSPGCYFGLGCVFQDCVYNCINYFCGGTGQCNLEQYVHCYEWCWSAATGQWYVADCSYQVWVMTCGSCTLCPRFIQYC